MSNLPPILNAPQVGMLISTNGRTILVDIDLHDALNSYRWFVNHHGYACRDRDREDPPGPKRVLIHRQVLGHPKGGEVDHINGDPLDNRRSNLRLCDHAENCRNSRPSRHKRSKYKGVFYNRRYIRAEIKAGGKSKHLGYFDTEEAAARAYDAAAIVAYGEFAWLNFPEEHGLEPRPEGV